MKLLHPYEVQIDSFTEGFLDALFFTESDETLSAELGVGEFDADTLKALIADCGKFQIENSEALEKTNEELGSGSAQHGHDFWLTRNRHGAGFWYRGVLLYRDGSIRTNLLLANIN